MESLDLLQRRRREMEAIFLKCKYCGEPEERRGYYGEVVCFNCKKKNNKLRAEARSKAKLSTSKESDVSHT